VVERTTDSGNNTLPASSSSAAAAAAAAKQQCQLSTDSQRSAEQRLNSCQSNDSLANTSQYESPYISFDEKLSMNTIRY